MWYSVHRQVEQRVLQVRVRAGRYNSTINPLGLCGELLLDLTTIRCSWHSWVLSTLEVDLHVRYTDSTVVYSRSSVLYGGTDAAWSTYMYYCSVGLDGRSKPECTARSEGWARGHWSAIKPDGASHCASNCHTHKHVHCTRTRVAEITILKIKKELEQTFLKSDLRMIISKGPDVTGGPEVMTSAGPPVICRDWPARGRINWTRSCACENENEGFRLRGPGLYPHCADQQALMARLWSQRALMDIRARWIVCAHRLLLGDSHVSSLSQESSDSVDWWSSPRDLNSCSNMKQHNNWRGEQPVTVCGVYSLCLWTVDLTHSW